MVKAVMISHFSRGGQGGLREQSLAALKAAGVEATVFESTVTKGSDVEVKRIAWHAIASGAGHDVLFFEDDITVNARGLRAALSADKSKYDVVTLCLLKPHLLTDKHAKGLVPLHLDSWRKVFHGSMGLWISKRIVDEVIARKNEFMNDDGSWITEVKNPSEIEFGAPCGFDYWIRDYSMSPAAFMPNPILHRRDQSTTIKRDG